MAASIVPAVFIGLSALFSFGAAPVNAETLTGKPIAGYPPVPADVATCRALPFVTQQFGQRLDGIEATETYLLMRYGPVFRRDVLSGGVRLVWKPLVPRAAVSTPLVVYTITRGDFGSVAIGCQTP